LGNAAVRWQVIQTTHSTVSAEMWGAKSSLAKGRGGKVKDMVIKRESQQKKAPPLFEKFLLLFSFVTPLLNSYHAKDSKA